MLNYSDKNARLSSESKRTTSGKTSSTTKDIVVGRKRTTAVSPRKRFVGNRRSPTRSHRGDAWDGGNNGPSSYWPLGTELPPDPTEWSSCLATQWDKQGLALNDCEQRMVEQCADSTRQTPSQRRNRQSGFDTPNRVVAFPE